MDYPDTKRENDSSIDVLYRLAPTGVLLSVVVSLVYALVMWPELGTEQLLSWLLAVFLLAAIRLHYVNRYRSLNPAPAEQGKWLQGFTALAALSGLLWGLVAFIFFPAEQPRVQMFTFVILTGMAAGAVATMATAPSCYRFYLLAMIVPLFLRLVLIGDRIYLSLAVLVAFFAALLLVVSRRIYAIMQEIQRARQDDRYRNQILEMIAKGMPLAQILRTIVLDVETWKEGMLCSIVLPDAARKTVLLGAAPSLPDAFNGAIAGMPIGPAMGSCGSAMYSGRRVVVEDIRTHPYWVNYRAVALEAGLLSCWSEPIKSAAGELLGAFAIYHRMPRAPRAEDIRRIEIAANLAGVAIERRALQEDHELAVLVYQNSSEAMAVTDGDNRVIAINAAFTQITGYGEEEVVGKSIVFSARNASDRSDYQRMVDSMLATGKWRGELWNYHKNGERIACRVAVNSICDADGQVSKRVILMSDITEQKRADELVWKQANYDHLVGLPNRRLFRDRLEQGIKKAQRVGLRVGLLFLDLDRFKEVNDRLGHEAGDLLLIAAARRISACVRESDTVARLGGDEFTVVLPEIEDSAIIERVASDIIDQIGRPFPLGNELGNVGISIGITVYPDDAEEIEELLRNADVAMYAAKNAGRNRFCYFTSIGEV